MRDIDKMAEVMHKTYEAEEALENERQWVLDDQTNAFKQSVLEIHEDLHRYYVLTHPKYSDFQHGSKTFIPDITDLTGLDPELRAFFALKSGAEEPHLDILVSQDGRARHTLELNYKNLASIAITTDTSWGKRWLTVKPFLAQSQIDSEELTAIYSRLLEFEDGHFPERAAFARGLLGFAINTVTNMGLRKTQEIEAKLTNKAQK